MLKFSSIKYFIAGLFILPLFLISLSFISFEALLGRFRCFTCRVVSPSLSWQWGSRRDLIWLFEAWAWAFIRHQLPFSQKIFTYIGFVLSFLWWCYWNRLIHSASVYIIDIFPGHFLELVTPSLSSPLRFNFIIQLNYACTPTNIYFHKPLTLYYLRLILTEDYATYLFMQVISLLPRFDLYIHFFFTRYHLSLIYWYFSAPYFAHII